MVGVRHIHGWIGWEEERIDLTCVMVALAGLFAKVLIIFYVGTTYRGS